MACISRPIRDRAGGALTADHCSFCQSTGTGIAIDFFEFMGLIKEGLFHLYEVGSEVGNPPTGGGDGRVWMDYTEVASEHCWEAVGSDNDEVRYAIFKAIENALGEIDPNWTYVDNSFPRLALEYGWRGFKRSQSDPDFESNWILDPDDFLGKLQQILTWMPGVMRDLPIGSAFWRARPYSGTHPSFTLTGRDLGSAPSSSAKANRMSAAGVSMFYGAELLSTSVEEVKYGTSTAAAAGRFVSAVPLRVVDLTEVTYEPSIFDANERNDYYAASFLAGFAFDISRPISDSDRDYLPTQAVTTGIREIPWDTINGIRFRSAVDPGGINYVLFFANEECGEADQDGAVLQLDPSTVVAHISLT